VERVAMEEEGPGPGPRELEETGAVSPEESLGGYFIVHHRPPAFEGPDGSPYTVSVEVETTPNLAAPYSGYLVFPRWAETGLGVVGHVETPTLLEGRTREEVETGLTALTLTEVRALLDEAVQKRKDEDD
jgi:hypothetical protein